MVSSKLISILVAIVVISSSAQGFHLFKKKLAAIAAGSALKASILAPEVVVESEPVYYQQAVAIPEIINVPNVAYLGVKESIPSVPAFKAGVISSLETAKDGAIDVALHAKDAVVNVAKAIFNTKAAIGRAITLPFTSAASGIFAASKAYNDYRYATPIYRFVPSAAFVDEPVSIVTEEKVVVDPLDVSVKSEVVGPSGYIVTYGRS